jgi:alginate O-acetyltransferase complex protein AlgI
LPLGGNKAYARNILIIFVVAGLWHGAGWTFIVWGLYHAALVVWYHFTRPLWDDFPAIIQKISTFLLVSLGWVLFIFDFQGVGEFSFSLLGQNAVTVQNPPLEAWGGLLIAAVVCFGSNFETLAENIRREFGISVVRSAGFAGLLVITLSFLDRSHTFIYFRF